MRFQRQALTDVGLLGVRPPEADSDDNGYDKEAHDDDYDDEPHFFVKCILVCSGRGSGRWVRYACTTEKAWRPSEYLQCTERKKSTDLSIETSPSVPDITICDMNTSEQPQIE